MGKITPHQPELIVIKPKAKQKALTVKLNEAILIYARAKAVNDNSVDTRTFASAVLAAYRMDTEQLFEWLEKNRYRWNSNRQRWVDLRQA